MRVIELTEEQQANVLATLTKHHTAVGVIPGMAIELWEDGEITSTKCSNGELYGLRNLHMLEPGHPDRRLPLNVMPQQANDLHGFCRFGDLATAQAVRHFLMQLLNQVRDGNW